MVIGKEKFALWITPEAKKEVEAHYKQDNCKSQSEYIEKAVRFYSGYLDTESADAYLPRVLADVLEGANWAPWANGWDTCCSSCRWTKTLWEISWPLI